MGMPDLPPPSSAISTFSISGAREITYRDTKPLPHKLLEQSTVCIEEQLFTQGISLLSHAVTSGNGTARPAYVPPVPHISLIATLAVHPSMTTRSTLKDRHAAADEALRYLRNLHQIAGVETSGLGQALQYQDGVLSRKRGKTRHSEILSDEDEDTSGFIRSIYAKKESLFTNADSFWAVVGWAFNCSVAHKHRWAKWKLWLELMLDVLESNLDAKRRQSNQSSSETLISQYLARYQEQGRNTKRAIMRAILADGKETSLAQFPEIWRNETRLPKKKDDEPSKKKRKLDLDHGDFGDYFDSDSDTRNSPTTASFRSSRNSTRAPSSRPRNTNSPPSRLSPAPSKTPTELSSIEGYGGIESIHLRQRLLGLLSRFCHAYSADFLDTEDLFDLFTEFLRPLPLPIFTALVLPAKRYLDPDAQSSLDQMLLRPLLSSNAPVYNANALTQEDFETYFATFAANTGSAVENAKVSVLLEDLLRLLWTERRLESSATLRKAVDEGIKARRERVGIEGCRNICMIRAMEWQIRRHTMIQYVPARIVSGQHWPFA